MQNLEQQQQRQHWQLLAVFQVQRHGCSSWSSSSSGSTGNCWQCFRCKGMDAAAGAAATAVALAMVGCVSGAKAWAQQLEQQQQRLPWQLLTMFQVQRHGCGSWRSNSSGGPGNCWQCCKCNGMDAAAGAAATAVALANVGSFLGANTWMQQLEQQ